MQVAHLRAPVNGATGTGRKILYFLPAALYYAAVFYLSSKTISIDIGIGIFDKFIHGLEFSGLGFLLALGFIRSLRHSMKLGIGVSWGIGLLLGALDEFHQYFVPGRQSDGLDFLADAVGVAVGVLAFIIFARKTKRLQPKVPATGPAPSP